MDLSKLDVESKKQQEVDPLYTQPPNLSFPLPTPQPWISTRPSVPLLPSTPEPQEICLVRMGLGMVMGAGLGFGLGIFLGAMGDMAPIVHIKGRSPPQAPLDEMVRVYLYLLLS